MRVLVTAGPVYGPLDSNKIVSNRVRGIWAVRFARWLVDRGNLVTLFLPDILKDTVGKANQDSLPGLTLLYHKGFDSYMGQCISLAETHHAAVMAAAVVNWSPSCPVKGKLSTDGYEEGAEINIPFRLAPSVINRMRRANTQLTLIGCKMLVGADDSQLLGAAEVTRKFLTGQQVDDFDRHRSFLAEGCDTGRLYRVTTRWNRAVERRGVLYDLTRGRRICASNKRMPPSEEALSMKFAVEMFEQEFLSRPG